MSQGRVEEILIYPCRGGEAASLQIVEALVGDGLDGDHRRHHNRQVSLLSREMWQQATADLGVELQPSARRANLITSGVDLSAALSSRLRVGAAQLLIRGETAPCVVMERVSPGLEAALASNVRGGVFGRVEVGGSIRVGDSIDILEEEARPGLATSHSAGL